MKPVSNKPKFMLRSKSTNLNIIKLSRKITESASAKPTQPKCLITTHYIGNLENKFGMFTREQTPKCCFTTRDKSILRFTNSKLNSLVLSPKTSIKYKEIHIQDAMNNGIDRFLHSINFSFQTNLNLFHSSSSRNINEANQPVVVREGKCNKLLLINNDSKNQPISHKLCAFKTNKGNPLGDSKERPEDKVQFHKVPATKVSFDREGQGKSNYVLPAIDKKIMFKRNYTHSDFGSLYSLFYLNSPNKKRIICNGLKPSRMFNKIKENKSSLSNNPLFHHYTELASP